MNLSKEDIENLLKWNEAGLIPGPNENFTGFSKRAEFCLSIRDHLPELPPFDPLENKLIEETALSSQFLYGMHPAWVPIFFSNHSLFPWDGAFSLIFQLKEESPDSAFIQLRKKLKEQTSYLGYSRKELVLHELSHIGRMEFDEPEFEEMLAWRSSNSSFRRNFGPIFSSQKESATLGILLLLTITFDVLAFFSSEYAYISLSLYLKAIPFLFFLFLLFKLFLKRRKFSNALFRLKQFFKSEEKANAVIYRLRDDEIRLASRLNEKELVRFMEELKEKDLRGFLITEAYPSI
ncbi:hypothetical protein [Criblamydia sequanensis]|uniref:Conserved putative membrane protein n=1 Tax=Candidatus Criblamydia sequanensis CRIB-18 TaxID=1437425 RepID=A0A090D253_9BACT|nr:hypothetical protein [Criblamydia sequanensis]CDR34325.1 Conserved putative membrane protein [Criblamydia sequanensis CRIB-18]